MHRPSLPNFSGADLKATLVKFCKPNPSHFQAIMDVFLFQRKLGRIKSLFIRWARILRVYVCSELQNGAFFCLETAWK